MNDESDSPSGPSGGCPVNHGSGGRKELEKPSTFWSSMFSSRAASPSADTAKGELPSGCPVKGQDVPASLEEAARHAQTPQADQRIPLGTNRQVSSIPRGEQVTQSDAPSPTHQHNEPTQKWVYPSEQQLYNAMRKKGWSNIPEESIPTVLQIHNNINERTWLQIQGWEGSQSLNLTKFQGRPRDMTPKAFLLSSVLRMYDPPFDRHDWYVTHGNSDSVTQRYVIDYYYLPPATPNGPPIPYVDARPALDHPRAVWLRSRRFLEAAFPGIATYLKQQQLVSRHTSRSSSSSNNNEPSK